MYAIRSYYGFVKKSRNKIRYRNLSDLINPAFGNKDKLLAYNKSRVTGPEPCVCHAPSRSLYFDIHGKATACCFNRANVLGKFPENSISEIIDGGKRRFLQTELCRQNFMYGCQHCHKLIEAGNFDGAESRLYDNLKDQAYVPVITSYSIHYTKLYDLFLYPDRFVSWRFTFKFLYPAYACRVTFASRRLLPMKPSRPHVS